MPRHAGLVRITHWITTLCFFALLVSGVQIVISHPRFYWGEDGNVLMPALFSLPIPASRGAVQTGYDYVLKDQNGWSRYLHFQTGWIMLATGLLYVGYGWCSRHFRQNLLPTESVLSSFRRHLRVTRPTTAEARSYNPLQRVSYLAVIFLLFPAMIWTGLAMSPAFTGAFPFIVDWLGGFQSARTIHFLVTLTLVLFVIVHVIMVSMAGFRGRMRAMIIGKGQS